MPGSRASPSPDPWRQPSLISRQLAARDGPIAPLIAETGGQNVMLVDSTALREQVVDDVIVSAFQSAGQRCSALRVLYLQEEIADQVLAMLAGAMETLVIGDPLDPATDIGPVIDDQNRALLERHVAAMRRTARLVAECPLPPGCEGGSFFPPTVFEIDSIKRLEREVFGPVLHVVRFASAQLDRVLEEIEQTGFGLTLGIHSRIDGFAREVYAKTRAGNVYINRNMIGAVVGVHPFGGRGPVRHRAQGGRAALSAALRHRANAQRQHRRQGRQCRTPRPRSIGADLGLAR